MFAYIQNVASQLVADVRGQLITTNFKAQTVKRISWLMFVYKSQEHELLKLDNI